MTFTSAETCHRTNINQDIIRIMQSNRGRWMSAAEISNCIRGRADSWGVGHRLQYLADEYPIETVVDKSVTPLRKYRYIGGSAE